MTQFAAHVFSDINKVGFNPSDYSKLKFGSTLSAKKFGQEMAEKFFQQHKKVLESGECLVIPSAYNMLEIAATLLAKHFMRSLNVILVKHKLPIVKWTIMHRTITYFSDYAHMSKEDRKKMLGGDRFFINKEFIKGKTLLFIDDVIITGTHEEKIKEFLQTEHINNNVMFLYYIKYTGNDPKTESVLNTSGVNCPDTYVKLINEPDHQIIVRTCKFLLNGSADDLNKVLSQCGDEFVVKLHEACLLEEYHLVDRYKENMKLISDRLAQC